MEDNNPFSILQSLERRYEKKILELFADNRRIVTSAFPPGTNVEELIREYLTSQKRMDELMGYGMLLSPQESASSALVLHNRTNMERRFHGDGMRRVFTKPGSRNNGMFLFLVNALLRNASLERSPRGWGRAWRNIVSRYSTGSVVQRQKGYSTEFNQHCLALANMTMGVKYGGWTFPDFCRMVGNNIGFGDDIQDELVIDDVDVDVDSLYALQISAMFKNAAAQRSIVTAERADASRANTLASNAKSDVFVKTQELSDQIKSFEAAFNGSPWGILVRCICNDPDMQNGSFTSSFFSEILLARVMLCYLYSIFFIMESSIPEVANLWTNLRRRDDCKHVVEVFQRNMFGPCNKTLLPYIKVCIRKAFDKKGAALLQTYLVVNITNKRKDPLLRVFGNGLFNILCKRSRSPVLVSPATYDGRFDNFAHTYYGIEHDEEDVDLSDIPDNIQHVEKGIAHFEQLISRAKSGAAGAAGDLAHAKIQLKRFKQKRQQLLDEIELAQAIDLSMQGGKKLIHKNKRSSKSNKRSKSNKLSKTNKRSKSMKRK